MLGSSFDLFTREEKSAKRGGEKNRTTRVDPTKRRGKPRVEPQEKRNKTPPRKTMEEKTHRLEQYNLTTYTQPPDKKSISTPITHSLDRQERTHDNDKKRRTERTGEKERIVHLS